MDRWHFVGHDRGARVAHRYALDHPAGVDRVAFLDIIPTREVIERFDATLAAGFWHWLFHFQPDLPEILVADHVREYLEFFLSIGPGSGRRSVPLLSMNTCEPTHGRVGSVPGLRTTGPR
jgi:pimeloyl-ACP methyl ester carboxylesterase